VSYEFSDSFEVAQQWANYDPKVAELFDLYCPAHLFTQAARSDGNLSLTIYDDKFFGMGFGLNPYWNPEWNECSVTRRSKTPVPDGYEVDGNWDVYASDTAPHAQYPLVQTIDDGAEIDYFIDTYAPNSSVRSGDPESLFWGCVRSSEGQLLSLGTVAKWRSGHHMFASIVTAENARGKGIGAELMQGMLSRLHSLGVRRVGLGVFAANAPAKRLYEKVGFELLQELRAYDKAR
jgi:ribosomal protein S18 acetylase RimI-like enzyme